MKPENLNSFNTLSNLVGQGKTLVVQSTRMDLNNNTYVSELWKRSNKEWKKFKSTCPIPLAGGENLLSDRLLTEAFGWLDYIQPDIGKWGGVDGCFDIAKKANISEKVYCPHWLSGGIGLLHSAHVLSAAGGKGLLEIDSNPNPLRTVITEHLQDLEDSHLLLGTKPGIGIDNPLENLTEYITDHLSFSS